MKVIYDRELTPHLAAWAAERIPGCKGFGKCTAQGVLSDDRLVGVMVYHNYTPEHEVIEISAASEDPRWLTRGTVNDLLNYPFEFCQMIVMRNDVGSRSHRIWKKFGANEYIIPRLRGRDADCAITTLTVEQWHAHKLYRGPKDGQG